MFGSQSAADRECGFAVLRSGVAERKSFLLRIDPTIHDALEKWAADELRSVNAQIEFLLRRSLREAGRLKEPPARSAGKGS